MNRQITRRITSPWLILLMGIALIHMLQGTALAATLPVLGWAQRSDWTNVKTVYGAMGNGTTDDTAALQAAINGVGGGGTVYLPAGNYKITSTLVFTGATSHSAINIIGNGSATTISWYGSSGTTVDMIDINSNPRGRYRGFILDGRGLAGVGMHHKNTVLFETEVRYQDMGFYNLTYRGYWGDSTGTRASAEMSFNNCIFNSCATGAYINGFNEYDYTFEGCDFVSCSYGIWSYHANEYVRSCYFQNSTIDDLYLLGPEHASSVRRCKSTGSAQFIYAPGGPCPFTVQDCYVTDWTGANGAIYAGGVVNVSFSRFVNPPDSVPPVHTGYRCAIIDCSNAAPSSTAVFLPLSGSIIYTVPAGSAVPYVGSANGANITTFVQQTVTVPTVVYDVKTGFSAYGDGIHDDTAAIQAAIDAAELYGNHSPIGKCIAYLPVGKYKITSTLHVSKSYYVFGGSGYDTALVWAGAAGGTMVSVESAHYLLMENMRIGHHDDGVQNNAVDIDQTSDFAEGGSRMAYDGIFVYGEYDHAPQTKGLRLNGLNLNCTVNIGMVQGNIRIINSNTAKILAAITYEGAITIDDPSAGARYGFADFQTRLSTSNSYGVYVYESNNIVMSDWYQEQNTGGVYLDGTTTYVPGRITIQAANNNLPSGAPLMTIDDYDGKVVYGPTEIYVSASTSVDITQTGTNPLGIILYGTDFYNCGLTHTLSSASLNYVADWISEGTGTAYADSYTAGNLTDIGLSLGDLQQLGHYDLWWNYSFVPV